MKIKHSTFFALAVSSAIIFGIAKSNIKVPHRMESLEAADDPDDPEGSSAYEFNRLKDPNTGLIPYNIRKKEMAFAAYLPKYNESSRSLQWQNRGPYNLGGRTRALALDVTNENIILAGQVSGGMWRSTDGGAHFTQTTTPQQLHSTTWVVQDTRPGHTNVWYYGTGEQYAIVNAAGFSSQFSGDGIFKSTDGGLTWAPLPSTQSNTPASLYSKRDFDFVWRMVTDPTDTVNDVVYAAVVNGVWRSSNGGNSWTSVLGLDTTVATISQYTSIAITSTGVLYATISSETPSKGIWRSPDGISWTKITPLGFPATYSRIEIGIAPSDETQVYFIAQTPGSGATGHNLWHYKYVSGTGAGAGGMWNNRTANIPNDHCLGYYNFDFQKYNSQSSYDMYVVVHPTDPNLVFLGGTDIYRSWNGFTTNAYDWIGGYQCDTAHRSNYSYPNHHSDQHRLLFLPSNTNVTISGTDGGLFKSNNIIATPVVWNLMNNGYNTGQFYTCAMEPGNTNNEIIVGGLQDNGTYFTDTSDYNRNWQHVFYGDGAYCALTHNRPYYYLSFQQGRVFKLTITDSGVVTGLTRMDPQGGSGYMFIPPFILDPFNDDYMYLAAGKTIWRNDSLSVIAITGNEYLPVSQAWHKLNGTTTGLSITDPNISTLDISEANTDRLYFGTDLGHLYKLDSCRTSINTSKVDISGSNFPAGAYLGCVETDRLNANNIMVTFSNYGVKSIFYTGDEGVTWTDVSGNLEEHPDGSGNGPSVTWAHIYNDGTGTKYYVGTSIGLYSTDALNGANTVWTQEGANTIGNVVIDMITSRTFDNNIVVATHGNGMYSNKIFTPTSVHEIVKNDLQVNCFPNPFNNGVTIEISSEIKGETDVDIFDIYGRFVRKINAKNMNRILWDGNNSSAQPCGSGAYLIRISANGKSAFRKVVKI